jgi:hypothetical protein
VQVLAQWLVQVLLQVLVQKLVKVPVHKRELLVQLPFSCFSSSVVSSACQPAASSLGQLLVHVGAQVRMMAVLLVQQALVLGLVQVLAEFLLYCLEMLNVFPDSSHAT